MLIVFSPFLSEHWVNDTYCIDLLFLTANRDIDMRGFRGADQERSGTSGRV